MKKTLINHSGSCKLRKGFSLLTSPSPAKQGWWHEQTHSLFGNLATTCWVTCTVALSCFIIVPHNRFIKKNGVEWKDKMSATAQEEIVVKRGTVTSPVWQYLDVLSPTRVRPMLSVNHARFPSLPNLTIWHIYFTTSAALIRWSTAASNSHSHWHLLVQVEHHKSGNRPPWRGTRQQCHTTKHQNVIQK